MKIMGISGLPGSGKSLISKIALNYNWIVINMGDIIREEAEKKNIGTGEMSVKLREEYGENVVAKLTVEKINNILREKEDLDSENLFLIEGIRSPVEIKLFKDNFKDFFIISVFSSPKTRFKRLKNRKRADDSDKIKQFQERDERELNFGIGSVVACSDHIILNEKDLDSYTKEIKSFLENL
jgi:dephospho-CoA kinase